jgi:hypothetical protein
MHSKSAITAVALGMVTVASCAPVAGQPQYYENSGPGWVERGYSSSGPGYGYSSRSYSSGSKGPAGPLGYVNPDQNQPHPN